jgi:2-amino-4-hydroxy-6-hydroxymethyldihydropteridine diphosphokinase
LRISTGLSPVDLLLSLQRIEDEVFNRKRAVRNGPRTMDIDILLYDDLMLESENLVIPHPEMTRRRFVLQPLNDIAPDAVHPACRRRISEILASLESDENITKI